MKMIRVRGKSVSEDTIVEALKKHVGFEETNVPSSIYVGQVYKISNYKRMVVSIGNGEGLTIVGESNSGCYSSSILTGSLPSNKLRDKLINLEAEYLGMFNDVFKEKC